LQGKRQHLIRHLIQQPQRIRTAILPGHRALLALLALLGLRDFKDLPDPQAQQAHLEAQGLPGTPAPEDLQVLQASLEV